MNRPVALATAGLIAAACVAVSGASAATCTPVLGANCSGADMQGMNMAGKDMSGMNMAGANMRGANMRGATMVGGSMAGADMRGADMRGMTIRNVTMDRANLTRANMSGAKLVNVKLRRSRVIGTKMGRMRAHRSDFSGSRFLPAGRRVNQDGGSWGSVQTGVYWRNVNCVNCFWYHETWNQFDWDGGNASGATFDYFISEGSYFANLSNFGTTAWYNPSSAAGSEFRGLTAPGEFQDVNMSNTRCVGVSGSFGSGVTYGPGNSGWDTSNCPHTK